MVKQERAVRTRHSLVVAAAEEFDKNGYEGTSLARVSKSAGISMGALTFHFPTKDELAEAVHACGRSATRAALERPADEPAPALDRMVALTVTLARLLREKSLVRACARLERDGWRSAAGSWSSLWAPLARDLAERADEQGELRQGVEPDTVSALVAHLVAGSEVQVREWLHGLPQPDGSPCPADAQLARIWELALRGLRAPNA
ncbi:MULTISPECIES: helix-turn-helix domain-containing protein [unclassified Streptomyces]|uniref:helix-turn-helix domain-containing protein n=1 Tax=unclassified Streptomyces TaxID=2593676 RepID=UPI0033B6F242